MENLIYAVPASGVLALLFAFWKASWVAKQDPGDQTMVELGLAIREGAMAFLRREYTVLAGFVVIAAAALAGMSFVGGENQTPLVAVSFFAGAIASGLAGYFGMRVATNANVRTTQAATKNLPEALNVAFSGGAVMGMCVVGLAAIGLGGLFIIFSQMFPGTMMMIPLS